MAKKTLRVLPAHNETGLAVALSFNTPMTSNQVGDSFYVPTKDWLLIIGNNIESRDRDNAVQRDADGNVIKRSVAQRIVAVRVVDGVPTETVELYVGSLVKFDANRSVAFNNDLFKALRQGDAKFKDCICGNTLTIVAEKEIDDRVWDEKTNGYKRSEDGKYETRKGKAFDYSVKASTLSGAMLEKANSILLDAYKSTYADFVSVDDEE